MSGEIQVISRAPETLQAKVDRLVKQRLAEIMARKELSSFQPFFESKELTEEFRRLQMALDWHKWHAYYERWNCLSCQTRERRHYSLGMCQRCYRRALHRLDVIRRELNDRCERAGNFFEQEQAAYQGNRPKRESLPAGRPKMRPSVLAGVPGERVKQLRQLAGLSQLDLATRAGVDRKTVIDFERGKRRPLPAHCDAIRKILVESLVRAFWP